MISPSMFSRTWLLGLGCVTLVGMHSGLASAQNYDQKDFERKGKRQGSFKKLKLKRKDKDKIVIKLKRKKTQRELEEEKRRAEAAKKVQRPKKIQGVTAAKFADKAKADIRKQKINTFKALIPNVEDPQRKAQLMYQLAEEYWEESKYKRFLSMEAHNKKMEVWDEDCRKRNNQKCPPAPKPDLTEADVYRTNAVNVYRRLLKQFPRYERADEVLYNLGFNLMDMKKTEEALSRFRQLLKDYKNSRYVPDAYTALADYYFNNTRNKVQLAMENYRSAMRVTTERVKDPNLSLEDKANLRGIHLRSIYMHGWCEFNVGEYEKALQKFKKVIKLSIQYAKTKESRVILRDEALRDLVLVFARLDVAEDAYNYFKSIMGPVYAYKATRRLAGRYYNQGNYPLSIKTYRLLMGMNPEGNPDQFGPDAPIFQNEVLRSIAKIAKPKKIYKEVENLMAYFDDKNPWHKRWNGNKKVWQEANEAAEQTLLEYSTRYHQDAQKEKENIKRKELYFDFAIQLYSKYLEYYPSSESAYELRFYLAELLYRKAQKLTPKARKNNPPEAARKEYARAAYQYDQTVRRSTKLQGQFKKQAAFSEILCYEALAGRTGSVELKGAGKKLQGLTKNKDGTITWNRLTIKEWDKRLLKAYERYLTILNPKKKDDKEERLQSFFKTGAIYYSYKHYRKSMDIFSMMAKEFPTHELSRRAAFMILYSYEDLKDWPKLEQNARIFIEDPQLTKNPKFKGEMYQMVIRSAWQRIFVEQKELGELKTAWRLVKYEDEFGKTGPWVTKKKFKMSPRAPNALAVAGTYFNKSKRILNAIKYRELMVSRYPETNFVNQIKFELGGHYEQIADYKKSATWYEKYVYGDKDVMKILDTPEEADAGKKKKKRKKRKKARRRRGKKATKSDEGADKAKADKTKKQQNRAIYSAALYRRGLQESERAIILYKDFIRRFPDDKEVAKLYLAIATIHEDNKAWKRAIEAFEVYLEKYQDKRVSTFLSSAVKQFERDLDAKGAPFVLKKFKTLKKELVENDLLIYAHAHIAAANEKLGNKGETEKRYMMVVALGDQMVRHKIKGIMGQGPALESLAQARFFLSERRRRSYVNLNFTGNSRKDKKLLKQLFKTGKEVGGDYSAVASYGVPKWTLAAVFRTTELTHIFVEKIFAAPTPKDLPANLQPMYKAELENFALRYEDATIDGYNKVLKKAAELGLYNEWTRLIEKRRNQITRKKNQINPYTVLSKRQTRFWLIEPSMSKLDLNKKSNNEALKKLKPTKTAKAAPAPTAAKTAQGGTVKKEEPAEPQL
ncbi:MAG: tetratricopeptide repeat protein [Myxococcales bacterium]|nr:tetratricopeptide repeat protein [Myxococcales bacterium]